jgi:enamine deaminase RidA (YjgF/YER057c/UK114 family)
MRDNEENAMVEVFNPEGIPAPVGPYSQVAIGPSDRRVAHIAGQVAVDDSGDIVGVGDFRVQCRQALANLDRVVTAIGGTFEDVVYVRGYLRRAADLPAYREERERFYREATPNRPPPTTTLVVSALYHPDCLVEIDAVAMLAS